MNKLILLSSMATLGGANIANAQEHVEQNNNILFIVVDDLRTELGCYGRSILKTPNIDRLANQGVLFERAYCNVPVSGASRASLLTGLRPTRTKFRAWDCRADVDAKGVISMPEHFKKNGYTTIANGKIYHHDNEEAAQYWDRVMKPTPQTPMGFTSEENINLMNTQKETGKGKRGYFYEKSRATDNISIDHQIATQSIDDLKQLKKEGKPFILSVGFIRPHLPFVAPERFWNMYDSDKIEIPDNYVLKEGNNIPCAALTGWSELRQYSGIPDKGALDVETAKTMIHGYYAATSFMDEQVGRVLTALKELELDKNTTVVLIGDNGWNLGEHGIWCKHCIMNTSLNVPMIISSPNKLAGYRSKEIVEYVDIFPTLCDLAHIEKPKHLEGESMIELITSKKSKSKGYAICRWGNGFTYINDRYFYTQWENKDAEITARLLFDHKRDKEENYNVCDKSKRYTKISDKLSRLLVERRGKNYNERN